MESVNTLLYLDTRRALNTGLYPLKLQVYFDGQQQYYPLYSEGKKITLSKEYFERSYLSAKPRQDYKELKKKLEAILVRAESVVRDMKAFTFPEFEKRMFNAKAETSALNYHYGQYIAGLVKEGRISTADNYTCSLGSITAYRTTLKGRRGPLIQFEEITPEFLTGYERWMQDQGKERTTVGFYLRPLRSIFNQAIDCGDIDAAAYPFCRKTADKGKYQIPTGKKVKKALDKETLGKLFRHPTEVPQQIKARDFWFFSYACNGMNVRDMLELRNESLQGGFIRFYRTKTINTTKSDPKLIQVPLNDFALGFIEKYRNTDTSPKAYLFPILTNGMEDKAKHYKVKRFTRFINWHLKLLAQSAGITDEISSNWGRHSFTTNAIRSGASMEYIKDALGHQSINTTNNYWGGFEDNVQKKVSDSLMDF